MMNRRKSFVLIAVMLTFAMLVFAACEPVKGLQIDKALKAAYAVESVEGKASLKFELVTENNMLGLLMTNPVLAPLSEGIELNLNEIKQQDRTTMSVKGELVVLGESVPVAMSLTQDLLVVQIEGISRPLVLDVTASGTDELGLAFERAIDRLNLASPDLIQAVGDYVVPNLPNPATIDVERTTVTINEEKVSVHKVHSEIKGEEVLDLLKALLTNLSEDEEGLRQLLDTLYDVVVPIVDEVLTEQASLDPDPASDTILAWVQAYLHNKTLVTEFLYTTITQGLETALSNYDAFAGMIEEDMKSGGVNLLNADTYLRTDLYVDRDFNIVRTDYELYLAPELAEDTGIVAVKITGSQELWNVNGDVEADSLDASNGIPLDSLNAGDAVLSSVVPNSLIGRMLTASGLNAKQVFVYVDDYFAYIEKGVTMAEAYSLSYDMGLDIVWHWDEGRVVLVDSATGISATLLVGENKIHLEGEQRDIPLGAQEEDYTLYLPVRAVAEAFGYEVQWDGDFQMVVLTKTFF